MQPSSPFRAYHSLTINVTTSACGRTAVQLGPLHVWSQVALRPPWHMLHPRLLLLWRLWQLSPSETPTPHSLALGQRSSPMFYCSAYLTVVISLYCLGTYLASCWGDSYCSYLLYCLVNSIVSWSLLSYGILLCCRYCLALSEVQTCSSLLFSYRCYCLVASHCITIIVLCSLKHRLLSLLSQQLMVPSLYSTISSLCIPMGLSK